MLCLRRTPCPVAEYAAALARTAVRRYQMRGCSGAAACEDWGVIPFIDLRAQYREIQDEVEEAVARVLADAAYVLGSEVESFESEFADLLRSRRTASR